MNLKDQIEYLHMWQMLIGNNQITKLNNKMMGCNFWSDSIEVKSWRICLTRFKKKSQQGKGTSMKKVMNAVLRNKEIVWSFLAPRCKKIPWQTNRGFKISVWWNHYKWLIEALFHLGLFYFVSSVQCVFLFEVKLGQCLRELKEKTWSCVG